MIHEWDLVETNQSRLHGKKIEVAVLPVGATEPHNFHLPEGQDLLHTRYVARRSCELAYGRGAQVICLPAIPYGVDCNLQDFPLAIHVSQDTLNRLVADIVRSLAGYGIRKILILNGHGGNQFKPLIRELQCELPVYLFLCDWWKVGMDHYMEIFEQEDDHAGEMETSVALALYPELVELEKARPATGADFQFEALRQGWVTTSRNFARLNDACGVGDPRAASAEKGKKYLDLVCGRISEFLIELARAPVTESFPHVPWTEPAD